ARRGRPAAGHDGRDRGLSPAVPRPYRAVGPPGDPARLGLREGPLPGGGDQPRPGRGSRAVTVVHVGVPGANLRAVAPEGILAAGGMVLLVAGARSEEHTSELQSPCNLVCRLL